MFDLKGVKPKNNQGTNYLRKGFWFYGELCDHSVFGTHLVVAGKGRSS